MLPAVAFAAAFTAGTDCAKLLDNQAVVFGDMSDGDEKLVTISGTTLKIDPWDNKQTWHIVAPLGADCSALVNFSVPGKPNPPPVPLKASLGTFEYPSSGVEGAAANKRATILFTDPSGTMAEPYYPLDAWVAAAYTS